MLPELPKSFRAIDCCGHCNRPHQQLFATLEAHLLACYAHEARVVLANGQVFPISRRALYHLLRLALGCPDLTNHTCDCPVHAALRPEVLAPSAPANSEPFDAADVDEKHYTIPRTELFGNQTLAGVTPTWDDATRQTYRLLYWMRNGQFPETIFYYDHPTHDMLEGDFSASELIEAGCDEAMIARIAVNH